MEHINHSNKQASKQKPLQYDVKPNYIEDDFYY